MKIFHVLKLLKKLRMCTINIMWTAEYTVFFKVWDGVITVPYDVISNNYLTFKSTTFPNTSLPSSMTNLLPLTVAFASYSELSISIL